MTIPENPEVEQQIANAVAEFHDLQARGENPDIEEFCDRHADLAAQLRGELQATLQVDELLDSPVAAESSDTADSELPETLSGHKILREIGRGGMGRVLLAEDERLGRSVAIKTLTPRYLNKAKLRARFMQEAQAMAKLKHPNIVQIFSLGRPEEIPHFVMEYVEGKSLTEAAKSLTIEQKVELMSKIAWAVDFIHQHQLIHRDLKPGNILVGFDLEPILLDFGLARHVDVEGKRLTQEGERAGTPYYFSPEQTLGDTSLDARSDIFSLGAVLYELLTGVVPFRADSFDELMRMIRETVPRLPRRINPSLPGDLQNICLKALEKNPADRYGSAREMAEDLERFLVGEPVLADPPTYARQMEGKIKQHLRELEGWRRDKVLSEYEFDDFRRLYNRLVERDDAWILEARRLSPSQVTLYLGACFLIVGATLAALYRYPSIAGIRAALIVAGALLPTLYLGIKSWKQGLKRIGIAFLIAFCLLLPVTLVVAMNERGILSQPTKGKENFELFMRIKWAGNGDEKLEGKPEKTGTQSNNTEAPSSLKKNTTNAQMWWSLLLSLPIYFRLRRFTKSSVFSLVLAVMSALLCIVTLLIMGLIVWHDNGSLKEYSFFLPIVGLFFLAGIVIEKAQSPDDSRYFYPIAVILIFYALSGVAFDYERYADLLNSITRSRTHGQLEYLFIINAAIYLILQSFCERFGTEQMRWIAKWFRFVIPGHVMTSLLVLGWKPAYCIGNGTEDICKKFTDISPTDLTQEAKIFEVVLPVVACLFVFGSIPKQMKNFLVSGMIFLAVGIFRLQENRFGGKSVWPLSLLMLGLLLMIVAANYRWIKLTVIRWLRRKPEPRT